MDEEVRLIAPGELNILGSSDSFNREISNGFLNSETNSYFFTPGTPSQRSLTSDFDQQSTLKVHPLVALFMAFFPCFSGDQPCTKDKKKDYLRSPRTITVFLVVIQLILFLIALGFDGFVDVKHNWLLGPPGEALEDMGAKSPYEILKNYQLWRYFTAIFLNAGVVQLLVNSFGQVRMGLFLESKWGWLIYLLIFVISGMGGIVLSCLVNQTSIGVGASASFMGILGAYMSQLQMTWFRLEGWQKKTNLALCLFFVGVTFLYGFGPNFIDPSAHIGGFFVGVIMGYTLFTKPFTLWGLNFVRPVITLLGVCLICLYFILVITFSFVVAK